MSKIFVIIVTFNGNRWIKDCLDSIRCSSIPVQTIVIDNASTDDTSHVIRDKFPEVILLEQCRNIGFAKANNLGIKKALSAGAKYLLLLNQDTKIKKDTIEILLKSWKDNQNDCFGLLSPLQLTYKGFAINRLILKYISESSFFSDLLFRKSKDVYEVSFMPASCWFLPMRVIEEVGIFCPLFFCYGEDTEYIERLKYYGWKVGFVSGTAIYHEHSHSKGLKSYSISLLTKYYFGNYVAMLITSTQQRFFIKLLKSLLKLLKSFVSALFSFTPKQAISLIFAAFMLFLKLLSIIRACRAVSKKSRGLWLN
jgi:GT2 family glycosyltransferase